MSVEKRYIIAPNDRERTAIVSIALTAGAEVAIDPTWRFLGWRDEMKVKVKKDPQRIDVYGGGVVDEPGISPFACRCGNYVSDPSGDAGCGNCGADYEPGHES